MKDQTIRKRTEPSFIEPMQCKPVTELPADEKWTFEIKFDGYRCIALKRGRVPTTSTGAARPASFGTAVFTLNDSQTAMLFTATIFNIDVTGTQTPDENDNLTAAHIHASPTVTPSTNAPVVWGFFGAPFNDNNPNDFSMTPFTTGVGGVFSDKWDQLEGNGTTLSAQLNNILTGHSYINFHTKQFAGGEIRGAIAEPSSTPAVFQAAGLTASSIQSTLLPSTGSNPLKPDWQRHVLASSGYLELGMIDDAALTLEEIAPEDRTRSEVLGARVAIS